MNMPTHNKSQNASMFRHLFCVKHMRWSALRESIYLVDLTNIDKSSEFRFWQLSAIWESEKSKRTTVAKNSQKKRNGGPNLKDIRSINLKTSETTTT